MLDRNAGIAIYPTLIGICQSETTISNCDSAEIPRWPRGGRVCIRCEIVARSRRASVPGGGAEPWVRRHDAFPHAVYLGKDPERHRLEVDVEGLIVNSAKISGSERT
jgi:hypothetical protein